MLNKWARSFGLRRKRQPSQATSTRPHGRRTTDLSIVLLGSCQMRGLSQLLRTMTGNSDIVGHELLPDVRARLDAGELDAALAAAGLIVFHDWAVRDAVKARLPELADRCRMVPGIAFPAFHPDADYVLDAGGTPIMGLLDQYQSSIAFFGWSQGLSVDRTLALYNADVYRRLGYFDSWGPSQGHLIHIGELCDLPLARHIQDWSRRGPWMYSMNHPRLFVLADIARALMAREGIVTLPEAEWFVPDDLAVGPVWPIYTEIAEHLRIAGGSYEFKLPAGHAPREAAARFVDLRQMVESSYETFGRHPVGSLSSVKVSSDRFRALSAALAQPSMAPARAAGPIVHADRAPSQDHPYRGLPDHQYWRRAIEGLPMAEVDPVLQCPIVIAATDRVATAGSCFAQHISRTLSAQGFDYLVVESGAGLSAEEATRRHFGVFSCRYGNVYTARQLLQLFERAHGRLTPLEAVWQRDDGRYVDPFRPQIEPDGHDSAEAVLQAQATHLAAVRQMFAELDVFVFTLGLTEAWRSTEDGMVYPLAPGVAGGRFDPMRHEFINFKAAEVLADLRQLIDSLHEVNPRARVLLTVSPVPLVATYEERHVLTSTTYSKSVLRVAAQELVDQRPDDTGYFPSYEVITGHFNRGSYFEDDQRSVNAEGVAHVMRLFMKHCSKAAPDRDHAAMSAEIAAMSEVICEEAALDPVVKA